MNIRRGLLRLWIIGSIAWICIIGFDGYRTYSSWEATSDPLWERLRLPIKKGEVVRLHLEWALAPPFVILISGAALGWALAGFRGTRRGNTP